MLFYATVKVPMSFFPANSSAKICGYFFVANGNSIRNILLIYIKNAGVDIYTHMEIKLTNYIIFYNLFANCCINHLMLSGKCMRQTV